MPSELAIIKTICENIENRLDQVAEGQSRIEIFVHNHETRITVLEHHGNLCPFEPRIMAVEENIEGASDHEARLKTLEGTQAQQSQRWTKWEGRIIALLQALIVALLVAFLAKGGP